MLRGLLIVLGILVVLLAVWMIVGYWRRRLSGGGWNSFRDWVRKPEWKASMSDYFAMREAAVEELSRRPPEELVEMLLDNTILAQQQFQKNQQYIPILPLIYVDTLLV